MTASAEPRFLTCGVLALAVDFGEEISREINARVLALEYLIEHRAIAGVTETVPTFRSLLVYYEPAVVSHDALVEMPRALARDCSTRAACIVSVLSRRIATLRGSLPASGRRALLFTGLGKKRGLNHSWPLATSSSTPKS